MRFYGQGQKVTGLEKSGRRTTFWNFDVWGDHAEHHIVEGQADPQYAAIPYLLVAGPDAASVTRRLQRLVGTTPLPPAVGAGPPPVPLGLRRNARPAAARRSLPRA